MPTYATDPPLHGSHYLLGELEKKNDERGPTNQIDEPDSTLQQAKPEDSKSPALAKKQASADPLQPLTQLHCNDCNKCSALAVKNHIYSFWTVVTLLFHYTMGLV